MAVSSAAAIRRLALEAPAQVFTLAPRLADARDCGRAVHFIDIENICGTADVRIYQARQAMCDYHAAVKISYGDHVIVGASHHNAVAGWNAWPGARLLAPRSGPDGADLALRDAIRTERIAERFTDVFLGSGDGGFAADLAHLAEAGSTTHVVAHPRQLSGRLRMAAHHVIALPTTHA